MARPKKQASSASPAKEPTVTAEGAGKIHKNKAERYAEGDVIEGGNPESIADLVRRGFVRFV